MSNVIHRQADRQTYATKAVSRFCKVTHTRNLYSRWKPEWAKSKLEALRERRPPLPKQIITPILTRIYQGGS